MMLSGLKAACDDLRYSADQFYDAQQVFDIQIVSTMGLDEDDLAALRRRMGSGVQKVSIGKRCTPP